MRSGRLEPTATELAARLARLEDERAIVATLYAYGRALDYGDRGLFLDCFTPDAEYIVERRRQPEAGFRFDGHDALGRFFDNHTHAPTVYHKHLTTNPTVVCDGETAVASSYFVRVDVGPAEGADGPLTWGRYIDELVRDEKGQWRMCSRRAEVENR